MNSGGQSFLYGARVRFAAMMRNFIVLSIAASLFAAAPALAESGEEDEDAHGKTKTTDSDSFVALPAFSATVSDGFHISGVLSVEAGLEIPDSALRAKAQHLSPRLNDAYMSALTAYAGGAYAPGQVPDADKIARMLQTATDEVLGQDGAHVLLGMVMVHEGR